MDITPAFQVDIQMAIDAAKGPASQSRRIGWNLALPVPIVISKNSL